MNKKSSAKGRKDASVPGSPSEFYGFVDGEVYFRVKFFDGGRRFPLIDTFVFIGKNLSDDDVQDTWYFQYAESVAVTEKVPDRGRASRKVHCAVEADIRDFVDLEELVRQLTAAGTRRRRLAG